MSDKEQGWLFVLAGGLLCFLLFSESKPNPDAKVPPPAKPSPVVPRPDPNPLPPIRPMPGP